MMIEQQTRITRMMANQQSSPSKHSLLRFLTTHFVSHFSKHLHLDPVPFEKSLASVLPESIPKYYQDRPSLPGRLPGTLFLSVMPPASGSETRQSRLPKQIYRIFRYILGKVGHVASTTHPGIAAAISMVSQYMSTPTQHDLRDVAGVLYAFLNLNPTHEMGMSTRIVMGYINAMGSML